MKKLSESGREMRGAIRDQGRVDNSAERFTKFLNSRALPTHWEYIASAPNLHFDGVYTYEDAANKRWVSATARLSTCVILNRDKNYTFGAEIVDFAQAQFKNHLLLIADGELIEWRQVKGKFFEASIPRADNKSSLSFELFINKDYVDVTGPVSFSFRRIEITMDRLID